MSKMDFFVLLGMAVVVVGGSMAVAAWRNRRLREFEAELRRLRTERIHQAYGVLPYGPDVKPARHKTSPARSDNTPPPVIDTGSSWGCTSGSDSGSSSTDCGGSW